MDVSQAVERLQSGGDVAWPSNARTLAFAQQLDQDDSLINLRSEFVIPSKADLKRKTLAGYKESAEPNDESIYFCGNSLGLQPKLTKQYLDAYLQTWATIGVGAHFHSMEDAPLVPFQDLAADCSRKSAELFGASPSEVVVMNTLTVNLHLMMVAFYRPTAQKHRILTEWRPFPSDYYAVESHIEWHGLDPKTSMLLLEADEEYTMTTKHIISVIDKHADELALILLPGIQYYSGQLLDIPTITAHARSKGITIGWDLAHAAGNVELKLHEWDVDFACWCTYKYMNGGAGSIAGAFIHSKHGDVVKNKGLRGWYGGDKSVRFLMDNKFVPTPGAQGFQLSNPSAIDLTSLSATLSVFEKTSMAALRRRSLLLTAYAEHLLADIASLAPHTTPEQRPFRVITPTDPRQRGAQLSVLIREDLMDSVVAALEAGSVICDKRRPGCIRVAPAPLYNSFADVFGFMEVFERAILEPMAKMEQDASDPTAHRTNQVQVESRI